MKLRLQRNSIRLRLTRPEVEALAETGSVSEMISFGPAPDQQLLYTVETRRQQGLGYAYHGGSVTVYLPAGESAEWVESERVGFQEDIDIGNGESLSILVEKDFKCLTDRPGEDDSDAYPHPAGTHSEC